MSKCQRDHHARLSAAFSIIELPAENTVRDSQQYPRFCLFVTRKFIFLPVYIRPPPPQPTKNPLRNAELYETSLFLLIILPMPPVTPPINVLYAIAFTS